MKPFARGEHDSHIENSSSVAVAVIHNIRIRFKGFSTKMILTL